MSPELSNQMSFDFPKKFEPELMGVVLEIGGSIMISLNNSFLTEELGLGCYGNLDHARVGKETEIFCPFCQKGKIRLKEIKPLFSSGSASRCGPRLHVGNNYNLDCSNDECDSSFTGEVTWMYID